MWFVPLACLTGVAANRFFSEPAAPEAPPMLVKVPIEVVRPGQPNEVIYIEIQDAPIPESGEGVRPISRSAAIPTP